MGDFNRFNKGGNSGERGGFGGGFGRKNFGGGGGGGRDFGARKSFGDRNDRPREMTEVVCSECGNNCQVPFKPSNDKPVFCNDCFASKRNGDDRGGDRKPERREFSRPDRREERRDAKPEIRFHDEAGESKNTKKIEDLQNEIKNLNVKIDSLAELFNTLQTKKEETIKPEIKKIEVKKTVAKKVAKKTVNKKK